MLMRDKQLAYLDYNATAPLCAAVQEVMYTLPRVPLNPSSVHYAGRYARHLLEEAKMSLLAALGVAVNKANAWQVVWTSSGTEANNMVLKSFAQATVVTSAVEHASALKVAQSLPNAQIIPVNKHGQIRLDLLEQALETQEHPLILSLQWVNNETGVIQPLTEAIALAKKYGALVHVDAVQALGKLPIILEDTNIDMLSLSGHKIGAPIGSAALIMRQGLHLNPLILGGGQQRGLRAGTESVHAIYGFGTAATYNVPEMLAQQKLLATWRDEFEEMVLESIPGVSIAGVESARVSNTSCVVVPGVRGDKQLIHCDMAGIAVSSGAACSSGKMGPSHVLQAMGYHDEDAACSIRVSMGLTTEHKDIVAMLDCWLPFCKQMLTRVTEGNQYDCYAIH